MKSYQKITPEGTRDLLFGDCQIRSLLEQRLKYLFQSRSYEQVMTPGFEFYDVFSCADRYFPQESMYKLIDNKGRLLVVRPDTTIPIARLVATKLQGHPLPIRLFYSQNVFRMGSVMNGDSHEIMQMGIELIGAGEGKADLEVLATGALSLTTCGIENYRLELGHVGIFKQLLSRLNASEHDNEMIQNSIENKNYSALQQILVQYDQAPEAALLGILPRLFGGGEIFAQVQQLFASYDEELLKMVAQLETIYLQLTKMGLAEQIIVDFGLVNQADYYSGLIFRGYIEGAGAPVLSGGRYDGLMKDFGQHLPAVGFGLHMDLIAKSLAGNQAPTSAEVLVYGDEDYLPQSLTYLNEMIGQGITCEYSLADDVDQAMVYAQQKGISWVHHVGAIVHKKEVS